MINTTLLKQIGYSIGLSIAVVASSSVSAHPHSWINMTTQIKGDDQQLTGFDMTWTFDAMTTAYLFDGEDMSKAHREATLAKLAQSVIDNMLPSHYFTYFFDADGTTPIRYEKVTKARLTTAKGKATLQFDLPLAKPYVFNGKTLTLKVFDPTYYVDMSWDDRSHLIFDEALKKHCELTLIEPHPTPEQVSYAMSLPVDADPDNALGQLFTQAAAITCQASASH
ncbi:DUF1007 family protein [Vibrio xiamenensis]|nr:DUF1007 family protein [Vibrio xiamenensis]